MSTSNWLIFHINSKPHYYSFFSDCGTSVTINNGFVNFTSVQTTFGQTVPILCNEGFELSGGSSLKCETNGKWTTTAACDITGTIFDIFF